MAEKRFSFSISVLKYQIAELKKIKNTGTEKDKERIAKLIKNLTRAIIELQKNNK